MLTRNREDAEDALQAAMVRVALKPRALADAQFPWPYFLRIVRNEALNIARRRTPVQWLTSALEAWHEPPEDGWADEEMKRTVRTALRRLPPAQSEVVVLKIWEQMTFAEIAEVLGDSPNTVASRYRYAIRKLSRHLEPYRSEVLYE